MEMVCTSTLDHHMKWKNNKMLHNAAKHVRISLDIPPEMYILIWWILVGPEQVVQTEMRSRKIEQSALTISLVVMLAYESKKQAQLN